MVPSSLLFKKRPWYHDSLDRLFSFCVARPPKIISQRKGVTSSSLQPVNTIPQQRRTLEKGETSGEEDGGREKEIQVKNFQPLLVEMAARDTREEPEVASKPLETLDQVGEMKSPSSGSVMDFDGLSRPSEFPPSLPPFPPLRQVRVVRVAFPSP